MAAIRLLAKLTHWLWMMVASLVIGYAVLVVVGRLMLPSLDEYRPDLTRYVSQLLGVEVEIESLSGAWPRLTPNLSADRVVLREAGKAVSGVEIGKISVELNPFQSLWQRELIWQRLTLSDVNIQLRENADGRWSITGFPLGNGDSNFRPIDMLLYSSLIEIDRVALTLNFYSGAQLDLLSEDILIENNSEFHRIIANLNAADNASDKLVSFVFEASGNPSDPDNFDGKGYLRLHQINLDRGLNAIAKQWFPDRVLIEQEWSALVDAELWFDIAANGKANIVGRLRSDQLPLTWAADLAPLENIYADITGWYHPGSDWGLTLQSLVFNWGDHQIVPLDMRFGQRVGARWGEFGVDMSRFDLTTARRFLLQTGLLKEKWQNIIAELNPTGHADKVSVDFSSTDGAPSLLLRTSVTDISVNPWHGAPGAKGLDGYLEMSMTDGLFVIQSTKIEMDYDTLFDDPIPHERASGTVGWHWDRTLREVSVISGPLSMEGKIGQINGQFMLDLSLENPKDNQLFLQLGARNSHSRYSKLFMPHFLDDELAQWLDTAIGDAVVENVGVIYRGTLRKEPPHQRTFQLYLDVAEGNLKPHEEWPALTQLDGSMVLSNGELHAVIDHALFGTLSVSDVDIAMQEVDEQGNHALHIKTSETTNANSLYDVILATPMGEQLEELASWQLAGDINARVDLSIPLSSDWQSGKYNIGANVSNGAMIQQDIGLELTDISGQLSYTNEHGLLGKNITAKLWGNPISGALKTVDNDIRISADGRINVDNLLNRNQLIGAEWVSGQMAVRGELTFPLKDSGRSPQLKLTSDTRGVTVTLPQPFEKSAEEQRDLVVAMELGDSVLVSSQYGKQVSLGLEVQDKELVRGYFGVNRSDLVLPAGREIYMAADLERIDLAAWESKLLKAFETEDFSSAEWQLPPIQIETTVKELSLSELHLTDAVINGQLTDGMLKTQLAATQAGGKIDFPVKGDRPIGVELDYLKIPKPKKVEADDTLDTFDSTVTHFDPRSLPAMNISVANLFVDEKNIGRAAFSVNADDEGLHARDIDANLFGLQIGGEQTPAEAAWRYDGANHTTRFNGLLQSSDIDGVLEQLGVGKVMQSQNALFRTDIHWQGRPWQLGAEALEGQVTFSLENGSFYADTGKPANAFIRLVGLFNFDTWLRRLKLDFSDLYEKGVSFDGITGSLVFKEGLVQFPEPVVADTPSGKMQMQGNIDMINELIDARFVATLPVGTNLPWLAALAINLPAAAGVWLVSKVFKKQVDNLSSISYKIDGSWDDPEITLERVFSDQNRAEEKRKKKAEENAQEEEPEV